MGGVAVRTANPATAGKVKNAHSADSYVPVASNTFAKGTGPMAAARTMMHIATPWMLP